MIDLYFAAEITPAMKRRLKKLDAWFAGYATDGLIGEEFDPLAMDLRGSARPSVCMAEDIDSLEVLEASDLGDGTIEARCQVYLALELDLNDDEGDTVTRSVIMEITLRIDAREKEIAGHRVQDAYAQGD